MNDRRIVDAAAYLAENLQVGFEEGEARLAQLMDRHDSDLYANDVQGDGKMKRRTPMQLAEDFIAQEKAKATQAQAEATYREQVRARVNSKSPPPSLPS